MVYYAQPPDELREVTAAVRRAAATGGDDPDVLYVGEAVATDEAALARPPPTGAFFGRFPLPWYTEAAGADVTSVPAPANLTGSAPPVVVTTTADYRAVARRLGTAYDYELYALDGVGDRTAVVFTRAG